MMSHSQRGEAVKKLSGKETAFTRLLLPARGGRAATVPEAEDAHDRDGSRGDRRPCRAPGEIRGGQLRRGRQVVDLGLVDEEEEGVETAQRPLLVGAVQVGALVAAGVQLLDAGGGQRLQLPDRSEADGV